MICHVTRLICLPAITVIGYDFLLRRHGTNNYNNVLTARDNGQSEERSSFAIVDLLRNQCRHRAFGPGPVSARSRIYWVLYEIRVPSSRHKAWKDGPLVRVKS
jgi:hypothetical protein